jgi:hypothetical protein
MTQSTNCGQPDVAQIAGSILNAFQRSREAALVAALTEAERFVHESRRLDTREAERLDVLRGAMKALEGPRQQQVQAGIYLLEHLASHSFAGFTGSSQIV